MDYPELSKKNIYCIPVGDFWGRDPYRLFLIYAPFIGSYMLATPHLALTQLIEELIDIVPQVP